MSLFRRQSHRAAATAAAAVLSHKLFMATAGILLLTASFADATPPPTGVELVHVNSTCLSFSVGLPPSLQLESHQLHVFMQPMLDGNATDAYFPLSSAKGPSMLVEVNNLKPDSGYVFTFYLESNNNGSSTPVKPNPPISRTHRLGPQIISFFASDPSPGSQPSDDESFSNGDTLIIYFAIETNTPPVGTKADIDKLFAFSQPIGLDYVGEWDDEQILIITVLDIGQSSPPLGELTVKVIGPIFSPDGMSDMSISQSPPLTGSFSWVEPRYFWPTKGGKPVGDPQGFRYYGLNSIVNQNVSIPLALQFPDPPAHNMGYGLNARVSYPTDLDYTMFALVGDNFTYPGPTTGTTARLTNSALAAALKTLTLVPKPDYVGYACVQVDLIDRMVSPSLLVSTVYMTVRIDGQPQPLMPSISAEGEEGLLSNPMKAVKKYQTPLIIGLSTVVGFLLLMLLGVCGYKKYQSSRDSRDFENQSLREEEPSVQGGELGPTRRFYYDAKV